MRDSIRKIGARKPQSVSAEIMKKASSRRTVRTSADELRPEYRFDARERASQVRKNMALTRDFKETIGARAKRDPRFREALFTEAINAYLEGDTAEGRAILRDLVNATVGFEGLAAEIHKPSKSLHRMLAPRGNPSTDNFFSILSALQKKTRVKLRVTAGAA
jgi:DNA-binding phage protein